MARPLLERASETEPQDETAGMATEPSHVSATIGDPGQSVGRRAREARRRNHDAAAWIGFAVLLIFPVLPFVSFSLVGNGVVAGQYALVAVSLVVLVGWVGQISLGHAGIVGVGAYTAGTLFGALKVGFPINILPTAAVGAIVAAGLGLVALRVRGLYLAVATLVFSWMADEYLFRQSWFTRHSEVTVAGAGTPGLLPYFDWQDQRTMYYAVWFLVGLCVFLCANLRDTRTGRAFSAVRGSEIAAASLGISVVRTKLLAFMLSGAVAAVAGATTIASQRAIVPDQFGLRYSLLFLSITVVGGLSSLGGAIASAWIFAGLNEIFFRYPVFTGYLDVVTACLLTIVLLGYRGGLAAMAKSVLSRFGVADRTMPVTGPPTDPTSRSEPLPKIARESDAPVIEARSVTVRFGGLTALSDASMRVHGGEIVGLIGPNGAGKTTLFNAIAGLNVPSEGEVLIEGQDVTSWAVDRRARSGVGRTFQAPQLFPELTVRENLLVAADIHDRSSFLSNLLVGRRTIEAEARAGARVDEIVGLMQLQEYLHRPVRDLPFGALRMVEVARALVTSPTAIMLDEPASGLDDLETERLIAILRSIRDMDVSLLLIEHDVAMVTSVCDRIYVLERGQIIAEGTADQIRNDPTVVAAYLGSQEEDQGSNGSAVAAAPTTQHTPAAVSQVKSADPVDVVSGGLLLTDIEVSYGNIQALRGVSMRIGPGERIALLGPNGAGKSTTLRAISGFASVSSGQVLWNGAPVTNLPSHSMLARGIAHVPEGRELFPTLSVEENLRLGHWVNRGDSRSLAARLDEVMGYFPRLRERRKQQARTLSGGEQQMLAIARALMTSPALLIVDELSLGLAPKIVAHLFEILEEVNRRGTALLIVEQFVTSTLRHTDRAYVLSKGQVVMEDRSSILLDSPDLLATYLGG